MAYVTNLYAYFGVVGILSLAAWIGAGLLALAYLLTKRRDRAPHVLLIAAAVAVALPRIGPFWGWVIEWAAVLFGLGLVVAAALWARGRPYRVPALMVLALAGLWLSQVNSSYVELFEPDPKEILEAQRREQEKRLQESQHLREDQASTLQFAEDDPTDHLDLAGVNTDDDYAEVLEANARKEAEAEAEAAAVPAYKQAGRIRREAKGDGEGKDGSGGPGGPAGLAGGDASAQAPASDLGIEEGPTAEPRYLRSDDLDRAVWLDAFNRDAARFLLLAVALLLIADYLVRFNDLEEAVLPLPLGSRFMNWLSPRPALTTYADDEEETASESAEETGADALRREVLYSIRRGEAVLYLGPEPPWSEARVSMLGGLPGPWTLPARRADDPDLDLDDAFVFEALWYRRAQFWCGEEGHARRLLSSLRTFLEDRHLTRAQAGAPITVVWAFASPLPRRWMEELLAYGQEANLRYLVLGDFGPKAPWPPSGYRPVALGCRGTQPFDPAQATALARSQAETSARALETARGAPASAPRARETAHETARDAAGEASVETMAGTGTGAARQAAVSATTEPAAVRPKPEKVQAEPESEPDRSPSSAEASATPRPKGDTPSDAPARSTSKRLDGKEESGDSPAPTATASKPASAPAPVAKPADAAASKPTREGSRVGSREGSRETTPKATEAEGDDAPARRPRRRRRERDRSTAASDGASAAAKAAPTIATNPSAKAASTEGTPKSTAATGELEKVKVACRHCGKRLLIKTSMLGKKVRCPKCKEAIRLEA